MGQRIKFTGYLDADSFEPEELDLADKSGLSSAGYEKNVQGVDENGMMVPGLKVSDLEDLEVELVDE